MFVDLGPLQHACKHPFGMDIKGANTLCQIILRDKVVFVDFLEQVVQRAETHAFYVPVKVLRQHCRHGGFRNALVQCIGDCCFCIGCQSSCCLVHFLVPK